MSELIEMVVESVRVHMLSSRHVVILKEAQRERFLPIWIGPWEASSIAMRLQGQSPERPLTHDLFASALEELGVTVVRVIISELESETYHARLVLDHAGRTIEVDARPSDAIALAVRTDSPIFAAAAVLETAGLGAESGITDDAETTETAGPGRVAGRTTRQSREGSPLERPGAGPADERLDVFRDFINSLDVDQGGGAPGSGEGPKRPN
jgi:bifunctional DNase/RNase